MKKKEKKDPNATIPQLTLYRYCFAHFCTKKDLEKGIQSVHARASACVCVCELVCMHDPPAICTPLTINVAHSEYEVYQIQIQMYIKKEHSIMLNRVTS